MYKILLFADNGCPQCQYVKETLKKYGFFNYTEIDVDDPDTQALRDKYSVKQVPYVVIFKGDCVVATRLLNSKEDVMWLVHTWDL